MAVSALSLTWIAALGLAGDWPQWRGPQRDGISRETEWSVEGKDVWKKNVGLGYSTVSIQGGKLYTLGWFEDGSLDRIQCLDAATGAEVWKHEYPADKLAKFHGGGSLSTPSVDGELVYVCDREARFLCLKAADGKVVWEKELMKAEGLTQPTWGFSASPLVLGDLLILNLGKVFALDKQSGKEQWKTKDYGHAYSTPVDFDFNGKRALAVFNGDGLVVLDLKDGKQLAFHPWKTKYDVNAATPVVVGDKVLLSSGYDRGATLVQLGADGTGKALWENKNMRNHMSGCVAIGEHFYGFDEAMLKCIGMDGEEKWRERGMGKGALVAAGDRLIVMSGKGELVVAEAKPDAYAELSRAKVLDGGVYWTTPVLVDGRIYCRNSLGDLVCRDHRNTVEKP
jgi:outer membrane protein assembly factor BamB